MSPYASFWRGQRGEPLSHVSCFSAVLFFFLRTHTISVESKHVQTSLEGDRETNEELLKVCVSCLSTGLWVGSLSTSNLSPSASCNLLRSLPARCRATPLVTSNSASAPWWLALTQLSPHFYSLQRGCAVNRGPDAENVSGKVVCS